MRFSNAFIPTVKEVPKEATSPSHVLLLRGGYVRMVGAGVYELLPLGLRVLRKISAIVREEMDRAGAQEMLMPAFVPAEYLRESGRWDTFGDTLLRLKDRKGADYLLGPTHEEVVTDLARREIKSYKRLPQTLYQIQMKYRDEPRPRAGLLRCREFLMKDAYSFDRTESAAQESYTTMKGAYDRIFRRLGLDYRIVAADSGAMGGSTSAEFQVLAQTGEDDVVACENCDYAANAEVASGGEGDPCPACQTPLKAYRGIEGGHIFILGTHYSESMGAHFLDEDGTQKPLVMGCYGIGISRLIAAAIEQNHDDGGIRWPVPIAPYEVVITPIGKDDAAVTAEAERLYLVLQDQGLDVLLDDRAERPGVKFKEADLLGIPLRIVVGKRGLDEGNLEFKVRVEESATMVPVTQAAERAHALIGELSASLLPSS